MTWASRIGSAVVDIQLSQGLGTKTLEDSHVFAVPAIRNLM
jgi:hypothetical protein